MEPINLNHIKHITSFTASGTTKNELTSEGADDRGTLTSDSDRVTLSPASIELYRSELGSSRFASMEEQSASKERQVNTWLTLEELETGFRRPFADQEEARLSTLSLDELMIEINNLPRIDEHGHLQNGFAGTEQGNRLSSAVANITIQSQYNLEKASEAVSKSMNEFASYVKSELGIDSSKYDIKFIDGKIAVVGSGQNSLSSPEAKRVQELLDNPKNHSAAKKLISGINSYNEAASEIINNRLEAYTRGGSQNRYLPKELAADRIMEGMNYSHAESTSHLHGKWLEIVADANKDFDAALKDGSHLANSSLDPGIFELTRLRQSMK